MRERIKTLKKLPRKTINSSRNLTASFRDPSGFVFQHGEKVLRQVNEVYKPDYEKLMSSGLYEKLTQEGLLIPHKEVSKELGNNAWKVLEPEQVPFLSYYYEWPFAMIKDAALATLQIQKKALEHGMSLKDASAFNMQFVKGKPVLIDTLSFEAYEEGKPWIAYKQFIENFLNPLLLMSKVDVRLGRISSVFLDGIPVDLVSKALPFSSKLNLNLFIHIHAHASSQKKYAQKKIDSKIKARKFSKRALLGLIDSLESAVKKTQWNPEGTQWEDYYEEDKNNYKSAARKHKEELVERYLKETKPKTVWDMGANTGDFSKIAAEQGAQVVSFDVDYGALEKNYLMTVKKEEYKNILPLFCDLVNPIGSLGWENSERLSLFDRAPADTVMALALIHHLAIPFNVPFSYLASTFSKLGKNLIIEFIEKDDSQVQILLANRKDIFNQYTKKDFEEAFREHFTIKKETPIKDSRRTLYLMQKK